MMLYRKLLLGAIGLGLLAPKGNAYVLDRRATLKAACTASPCTATSTLSATPFPTPSETPTDVPECHLFQQAGYTDIFNLLVPTEAVAPGDQVTVSYEHPAGGLIRRIRASPAPVLVSSDGLLQVATLESTGLPVTFSSDSPVDTDGSFTVSLPNDVSPGEYLLRVYFGAYKAPGGCSLTAGFLNVTSDQGPGCTLGALVCTSDLTAVQQCVSGPGGNELVTIDTCAVSCRQSDDVSATCSGSEQDIPVDDIPVDDIPDDNVPTDDIPVDDVPADDIPVDDEPIDDVPVDDEPIDDIPSDELPPTL